VERDRRRRRRRRRWSSVKDQGCSPFSIHSVNRCYRRVSFSVRLRYTSSRRYDPSPNTCYIIRGRLRRALNQFPVGPFSIICNFIYPHRFSEMARRSSLGIRRNNFRPRSAIVQSGFTGVEVTGRFPFIRRTRHAQTGFIYFIVLLAVIAPLLFFLMVIFRH